MIPFFDKDGVPVREDFLQWKAELEPFIPLLEAEAGKAYADEDDTEPEWFWPFVDCCEPFMVHDYQTYLKNPMKEHGADFGDEDDKFREYTNLDEARALLTLELRREHWCEGWNLDQLSSGAFLKTVRHIIRLIDREFA